MNWFYLGILLLNWEECIGYFEEYLPVVGETLEVEFTDEIGEIVDAGDMEYRELTETLQDKLDLFVSIDWPNGVSFEQDDIVDCVPEHVYVLYPGTELVIGDLMAMGEWIASIPWATMFLDINFFNESAQELWTWIWAWFSNIKIPWSRKFIYRDATSGITQRGELFDPPKSLYIKPIVLRALVLAIIIYFLKKTGLVKKIWTALKGVKAYKNKKMVRTTLLALTEGQIDLNDLLDAEEVGINTKLITIDAIVDDLKIKIEALQVQLSNSSIGYG